MRLIVHSHSFTATLPLGRRLLRDEIAKGEYTVYSSTSKEENAVSNDFEYTENDVFLSLAPLTPEDLPQSTSFKTCQSIVALTWTEDPSESTLAALIQAGIKLFLCDTPPIHRLLSSGIMERLTKSSIILPPALPKLRQVPTTTTLLTIVDTPQKQATLFAIKTASSILNVKNDRELVTLGAETSIEELCQAAQSSEHLLNLCQTQVNELCLEAIGANYETKVLSSSKPSAPERVFRYLLGSINKHQIEPPPPNGRLQKWGQNIISLIKDNNAPLKNTTPPTTQYLCEPTTQLNVILRRAQKQQTPDPYKQFLSNLDSIFSIHWNENEIVTADNIVPLYPKDEGYQENYEHPTEYLTSRSFLMHWNRLTEDNPARKELQKVYKQELEDYTRFAVFRTPNPKTNKDFFKCASTFEGWLKTCSSVAPLKPDLIKRRNHPHALNPFVEYSLSDIVIEVLGSVFSTIQNPETCHQANETIQTALTILDFEASTVSAPSISGISYILIDAAKKNYQQILATAQKFDKSHSPKNGYFVAAAAILTAHGQLDLAREALSKQQLDETTPLEHILVSGIYHFLTGTDNSQDVWRDFELKEEAIELLRQRKDLLPIVKLMDAYIKTPSPSPTDDPLFQSLSPSYFQLNPASKPHDFLLKLIRSVEGVNSQ